MVCVSLSPDSSLLTTFKAEEALAAGGVPVGCVFVRDGKIIAKARNRTNELRNVRSYRFPIYYLKILT